ncbi:MAG: efflux RND transporter periplasmic adaptor subunit [Bacteroidota bacterium]
MQARTLILLLLTSLVAGCGGIEIDENTIPAELEAKEALLREKRSELRVLTSFIEEIQDSIYAQDPGQRPEGTLVTTQEVAVENFTSFAELQATVAADESAMATSEIGGRLLRLNVDEGDLVRRGQAIATVDVQAFLNQKTELETQLSLARTTFERQERLWNQNIGSEIQFLQAQTQVQGLEDALTTLQTQIDKQTVYAPISGSVNRVMLRSGELASPGLPIVEILSTNSLVISADVPENFLRSVRRGDRLKVKIPNLDTEFESQVSLLGSTVDPANRTFKVELQVPRSYINQLKPNMLAEVEIAEQVYEEVISVPLSLIQQEVNGRTYVFVVGDSVPEEGQASEKIAEKRYVRRGDSYEGQVIIEDGLTAGELLIDRGARGLVDQQPISITTTTSPADNG